MNLKIKSFNRIGAVFISVLSFVLIPASFFINGCSDQQAAGEGFSMPPMPVEVADVVEQNVSDRFEAVGSVEAIDDISVVSEIDAAVISLPFNEGGFIKKGEVIAQLDDDQLAAEVLRAEALYDQNMATYNRVKLIVDQKAGTLQGLDDAEANLKVAEANLKLAKARFNKTRIVAPFDGLIGSRQVSVGAFLRTGDLITTLANLNTIRIRFSASESFLAQLKRGGEVKVSSPIYPADEITGKIIVIEPVLDPETRNVQIVAQINNPGQKFRPGMSVNISVILTQRAEALTIPNEAIFASGDQSFVFVVNPDSSVKRTAVTTGLQLSDVVEVVQGLEKGMQVVRAGHQKLFEGAKVMPVNSQPPASMEQE